MAAGKAIRLIYDLKRCTGVDVMGGLTIESFQYFGRGANNELAYLAYEDSHLIQSDSFVYSVVSAKIYENQQAEIVYLDFDLLENQLVSNTTVKCSFGFPDDGITFVTGYF